MVSDSNRRHQFIGLRSRGVEFVRVHCMGFTGCAEMVIVMGNEYVGYNDNKE